MERARSVAADALERAKRMLAAEEEKLTEARARAAQHRQLQERNQRQLDTIANVREATAASLQLEQARRMATEAEGEAQRIGARVTEARDRVAQGELALAEIEETQESDRAAIGGERRRIEENLRHARMKRDGAAKRVSGPLLVRYDKIRRRHGAHSFFPLRDGACSSCDTAIPMQRRHEMSRSGSVELCEACGVLLYAPE
jgi:predicted  nucleic acid-binding Zn-ribbon protein